MIHAAVETRARLVMTRFDSRFLRFALVGAGGFAVDAIILSAAVHGAGLNPFAGRILSIAAAMLATWLMNRRFTFGRRDAPTAREGAGYASVKLAGQVLNYAVYSGLLLLSPLRAPVAALALASIVVMFFNYTLLDRWLYRRGA